MHNRVLKRLMVVWLLLPFLVPARTQAISITFDLDALGTNHYRYTYTVLNDGSLGAGVPVELFDIAFDPALYAESSLAIVTPDPPASGWSEMILSSAPGVPAVYDALALAGGIPIGAAVAGFAVEFTWLAPGTPGAQPFQIFDPDTFALLEEGITASVPEPGTMVLLSLGLEGLIWWRKKYGHV